MLDGDFDVGIIPCGILEKMYMEGKIGLDEFKVIHPQEYDDYPFFVSTRPSSGLGDSKISSDLKVYFRKDICFPA